MLFGMVATAPKETLSNMEQTPVKIFLEAFALFGIKRFLEQSYVGAIMITLITATWREYTVFHSSGDAARAFGH